jgi:hypothetical protein
LSISRHQHNSRLVRQVAQSQNFIFSWPAKPLLP